MSVSNSVLVVEDDERIRAAVRLVLVDEGYRVAEAVSGEDALEAFQREASDLVLVDLMLPGISGFEVCRALRQASGVPIIIVTARTDTHDVVAGLEAGADDYLTKPFAPKELAARMRALLRRVQPGDPPEPTIVLEDLRIERDAGRVTRDDEEIPLTRTEFHLLCELAEHSGQVLSREQLLERVWGYDYLGDGRLVDAHIRRLRTKIERDPSNPDLIRTVRGLGYRLQRP